MAIYAVYLPLGDSPLRAADQAKLVRQGFNWNAFLMTPVWALRHGLWRALALWLGWTLAVASAVAFAGLDPASSFVLYGLGALAFGLEADQFRQAGLTRSGYFLQALTQGGSTPEAEIVYFRSRADLNVLPAPRPPAKRAVAASHGAHWRASALETDFLGLFPSREHKS
jgi:hypothetical protein